MQRFTKGQTVFIIANNTAVAGTVKDIMPASGPDGNTAILVERRTTYFRRMAWIDGDWVFADEQSAERAIQEKLHRTPIKND